MIIGESMVNTCTAYSPWFERVGNAGTFMCEVVGIQSSKLIFEVEHKNTEDADSAAASLGSATITAAGIGSVRVSGLKELVRLKYTVQPPGGAFVNGWTHYRMLNPIWERN